jgi:Ca2+-binding RTX toxin-like protein
MADLTASDFIFNVTAGSSVAVTVQTPDGYDFSTLYDDLAVSNPSQSANDANHIFAVDLAKGITFEVIGTGIYDTTAHQPTSGVITEIDILNTTDPTQTTQDHVLVNTDGWSINASAFFTAIGTYAANNVNTGLLDAIFNAATYNIVGSPGFADNNSDPHVGADVFFGGAHADVFNGMPGPFGPGDPGSDTVDYSHATSGVTADLLTPANNSGAAQGDVYISIENLRGTAQNDTLTGDGNNNVLEGGLGHNILNGNGGSDTASYEHAASGVTVDLTITGTEQTVSVSAGMFDTLNSIENIRGSSHDDTLTGNGSSVLEGGAGNDHLIGQGAQDTASYEHATAGVTVDLSNSAAQNTGGAGTDTLINIANLSGSHFADTLTGTNGNNVLFGNGGHDTFVFNASIGHDTIGDYNNGSDHIELNFAAPFVAGNEASFQSWATSLSHVVQQGNDTLITFDTNDTILLKNVNTANVHASDFILPNHA